MFKTHSKEKSSYISTVFYSCVLFCLLYSKLDIFANCFFFYLFMNILHLLLFFVLLPVFSGYVLMYFVLCVSTWFTYFFSVCHVTINIPVSVLRD